MKSYYDEKYKILTDVLKELRLTSNMTQQELAVLLGCDQSYISKYEMSQRRLDVIEVRSIVSVFGVSLTEFVEKFEARIKEAGLS